MKIARKHEPFGYNIIILSLFTICQEVIAFNNFVLVNYLRFFVILKNLEFVFYFKTNGLYVILN